MMDCGTFKTLWKEYSKHNEGLFELINEAKNKPPSEPPFPAWTYEESFSRCKNYTDKAGRAVPMPLTAAYEREDGTSITAIVRRLREGGLPVPLPLPLPVPVQQERLG